MGVWGASGPPTGAGATWSVFAQRAGVALVQLLQQVEKGSPEFAHVAASFPVLAGAAEASGAA